MGARSTILSLSLVGCVGATGPAGVDGDPGAPGVDGDDGAPGAPGVDGDDGTPGRDGADGALLPAGLSLTRVGRYETGRFNEGAADGVAFDPGTAQAFVVNGDSDAVDVLDLSDPAAPQIVDLIDPLAHAGTATLDKPRSVAIANGLVAVAVSADPKTDPGVVQLYDAATLAFERQLTVCARPEHVAFSADGTTAVVACEGEPDDDYAIDPEGGVAILDVSAGPASATVALAGFDAFDSELARLRASGVRIYGPGASVSEDLEPARVAIADDGRTAWVTLQENNALAIVDVATATVMDVWPLGTKDHALPGAGLDPSDRDGGVHIASWNVRGLYQPSGVAAFDVAGRSYVITANEGEARDYDGFSEQVRIKDLTLDPTAFPDAATLQADARLGRLRTTDVDGDTDGDGDVDVLYSYGGRSFAIWDGQTGQLLFDSGDAFEVLLATRYGARFNTDHEENAGDTRSDDKGCEPKAVAVGHIGAGTYAFIGLERMGGVMVYDVTTPEAPRFLQYVLDRDLDLDFDGDDAAELSAAGDLGPKEIVFVDGADTPTGTPWLVVANEISGTTSIYDVSVLAGP